MICKYISSGEEPPPVWWDAHNHLQDSALGVFGLEMWQDLAATGVGGGLVNGTCPDDWPRVSALVQAGHPGDWRAAYGVHPWRVMSLPADWLERLEAVLEGACCLGEVGLDRWVEGVDFQCQKEVFRQQWDLAARLGLPVTVHCLRAWSEVKTFMENAPLVPGFLLHAYGGPADQVARWVQRGAYFSFSGSFLDRPKKMAAYRQVPLDRLLVETDAPSMLPPQRFRFHNSGGGEAPSPAHHPASLPACAAALADWLGVPAKELAQQMHENFRCLFG